MALLFMDGFDCYDNAADAIVGGWSRENVANNTFSTSNGRFGGGCLNNTSQSQAWGTSMGSGDTGGVTQGSTAIIGFAYYHDGLGGSSDQMCIMKDTGNRQIFALDHDASGDIVIQGNPLSTVGTTTGSPLTANNWHWVEIKVKLGTNSSNGEIELRIDEVVKGTFVGIDTIGIAGDIGSRLLLYGSNGTSRFDDLIILDTTGTDLNDYPGDCRIETLLPSADAATVDWAVTGAANDYLAVDDANGSTDGDTTYISSGTVAQESRFAMSNLAGTPDTVFAVQVRSKSKKVDAGSRTFRGLVRHGGVESVGGTRGLSTDYVWIRNGIFENDPGGADWDNTKVNAIEAGVEIVA